MEKKEVVIEVENLNKNFTLFTNQKERLLGLFFPKKYGEAFKALKNINFKAYKGETVGFVGINGSGKSTLLNIIAGTSPETSGKVSIKGKISILTTNEGFKDTLTGRENLHMRCLMLGFSHSEIKEVEEEIIEFSELDKFIDQPMKSYSSGMRARLGFSISINVDSDILIVDEALATGDQIFANKCLKKIKELQEKGKTIIFVSHSGPQIKQFCDKVLWLEYGVIKDYGETNEIMKKYEQFVKEFDALSKEERKAYQQKHKFN